METVAEPTTESAINTLQSVYRSSQISFAPEDSPFSVLFADLTHRCNMACHNCYIPERELPDLPAEWLYDILSRLPRRTRIRLVGAEPTVRKDLPEIARRVRSLGHTPVVMTNGLKLGRRSYVTELKQASVRTIYLSLNGGLRDDLYTAIDGMPCARRKLMALDNCMAERMLVTAGMILVPGINDFHLPEFLAYLLDKGVRDIHLRSVGPVGRHMEEPPFDLDGLEECLRGALPAGSAPLVLTSAQGSSRDFRLGRIIIQLTEWPDLGSLERGRITPEGRVEPMFESIVANAFSY